MESPSELEPSSKRPRVVVEAVASTDVETVMPPEGAARGAHVTSMEVYRAMHERSLRDPSGFWAEQAHAMLSWDRDFTETMNGSFEVGDIRWFTGGKLNVSYNCLDRHAAADPDRVAFLWEGDEIGTTRRLTYAEALQHTCRIANVLLAHGVRKGDSVAIYMPMIPELAMTMLACSRIGAVHSVVFGGFSADSLRDRILDAATKWVVTGDEGRRGGKLINLKHTVDTAVAQCPCVEKVFVFEHTKNPVPTHPRDLNMTTEMARVRPYCPPESMDAEDPLFLLYTSGSTGKPKGLMHTTGGYLLYAAMTFKYTFDHRPGDIFGCVADCGWITGHSYIVYGPLANGATTLLFESTPLYPDAGRYWELVQRYRLTQLYTAPTAIRSLMRFGDEVVRKYDLSSLRVLGSVGEPINPEAWRWYHGVVGQGRCAVVDTFWQTETGGHMITPLPGCTPTKPGSATFPFFGVDPVLLDPTTGAEITSTEGVGVLCVRRPWPGIARTVYGDHDRFLTTYMRPYKGYYFTGDGATRDADGYYWITGRVDDVMNVSGHRLGSAEIESALVAHGSVAEAAVIGYPHDTKGQGICCYVTLKEHVRASDDLVMELRHQVRSVIGPFATPDHIILTPGLPKTRSGKIMRRILRKIISQETDSLGDISTLADPSVVETLIVKANAAIAKATGGGGGGGGGAGGGGRDGR